MKSSKIVQLAGVCLTIVFVFLVGNSAAAEAANESSDEQSVSVDLNADFLSGYVWRGQRLNKDWVFQPSIDIGYESLTATIWGNMDLSNQNDQADEFSEIDYTLEQSDSLPIGEIEGLNYTIGAVHYSPHGNDCPELTEGYWGFGYDCFFNPSIKTYHDTKQGKRAYVEFSVGHSFEKIMEISSQIPVGMELGATIGWGSGHYNRYYWGTEDSSLNDLSLTVSFPVEFADGWTFTPGVNYISLLDNGVKESDTYSTKSDYVVVTVGLSKSF
jgi:hypothetical protein